MVLLENDIVLFGFDSTSGRLVKMLDKRSGREHIHRDDGGRLFRVVCPSATWLSRYADADASAPPVATLDVDRLTLHYDRLQAADGPLNVAVTVDVHLPDGAEEARFGLTVQNNGPDVIHEVRYPWIGGWESYGGPGEDRALIGCHPIDPHSAEGTDLSYNIGGANRRNFYSLVYTMLPFADISGPGAGISYICYSKSPIFGGFVTEHLDQNPDVTNWSLSWVSSPFLQPGETWTSVEIGIGVHSGDWHTTADRYREFMDTWWTGSQASARVRESIGFQVLMARSFDGLSIAPFSDLPRIAESGKKYGVEDLCVWDSTAALYLRPDDGTFWEQYDPEQTLDDLREGITAAGQTGVNVSTLVNYRLIRENSSIYREIGDAMVQMGIHGSPINEDWSNISSSHASFRTDYLTRQGRVLCQKSEQFREMARSITDQTMQLGFTSLFIDQTFDLNPCFADNHGHMSPNDTPQAVIDWVSEVTERVRQVSPETYLIGENVDVFCLQYIDVNWVWNWESIAPEVMRYTIPESVICWVVDRQPRVLNRAFALGSFMALTTAELTGTLDEYPEYAEHVKSLAELRHKTADFIAHGRFRDTIGLESDGATTYIYKSDAGLAVVIANTEDRKVDTHIAVDASALGSSVGPEGTLFRSDGTQQSVKAQDDGNGYGLDVSLPPYGVAIWALR
jgi:hypothetical protein